MPYQGSSQSVGFRNRQVIDPSKRMREEAAQIKEQGRERIQGMERQASQEIQEMKRVSDLQASNARYELNALAKFSNSINTLLQETVVDEIRENRKEQVNRGIEMFATDPEGARQEREQTEAAVEQQRALHDRIEAEAQKAPTTEAANRIRSLSKFEQMGWDFAAMREAANGWDAHREAELTTNETVLLDHDGTPFVLKDYDPTSLDQYDIAVRYLQTEYIDSHNPKGFNAAIRNTTLTAPILERSATARKQMVQKINFDRAAQAVDAQENQLAAALRGDPGAPDPAKQIITFMESTHKHFDTMGAQRGGRVAARTRVLNIANTIIESSEDARGTAAQVITALKSAKVEGHPSGAKTLFELYQDEFSEQKLLAKGIEADVARNTRELQERRIPADEEFRELIDLLPSLSETDRVIEIAKYVNKYPIFTDNHAKLTGSLDNIRLNPERSKEYLEDLRSQNGEQPVALSEVADKLDPEFLKQAVKDGLVEENYFGSDSPNAVKAAQTLVTQAISDVGKTSISGELTGAASDLALRTALVRLEKDARAIYKLREQEGRPITQAEAYTLASKNLVVEIDGVNDKTNQLYNEKSDFYSSPGDPFPNLVSKLPSTYVQQTTAIDKAKKIVNEGKSIRNTLLVTTPSDLELNDKGVPTPLIDKLAGFEGVTSIEMLNAQRKLAGIKEPVKLDPNAQLLTDTLNKYPHLKTMLAQDKSPATVSRVLREAGIPEVRALRKAIGIQESNNRYDAYNDDAHGPDFPALGKYQIMWYNLNSAANKAFGGPGTSWAKELGMPEKATMNGFLRDKMYQERMVNKKFDQYIQMAAQQSDDLETIIRMAAAAWYGGPGAMEHWDNPNYGGGEGYPSMQEYTTSVWSRY